MSAVKRPTRGSGRIWLLLGAVIVALLGIHLAGEGKSLKCDPESSNRWQSPDYIRYAPEDNGLRSVGSSFGRVAAASRMRVEITTSRA